MLSIQASDRHLPFRWRHSVSELKSCFVISPIGEQGSDTRKRADQVLKYVIKPAVKECGYTAKRADEIGQPGIITNQIIQRVIDDDLIVADLTGGNPNVFYELAIRHTIKKPIVQIIKKDETIPFDVDDFRTVRFDLRDPDSIEQAKEEIVQQIQFLERNPENLITPVSISVGIKELGRSGGIEKLLGILIEMMGRSLDSHVDLIQSTLELNEDTRKSLRTFQMQPRGLMARTQGGLRDIRVSAPEKDAE